jgi:L1 cell adhesion molecule like protein
MPDEVRGISLVDVTALPLGVKEVHGKFIGLIGINTSFPCTKTHTFVAHKDFQKDILIELYSGHRSMAVHNDKLGQLILPIDPPMLARDVKIEVTFSIDVNGILSVQAIGNFNNGRASLNLQDVLSRLSRDEIDKMRTEVELYKVQDAARKNLIFAKMRLEHTCRDVASFIQSDEALFMITSHIADVVLSVVKDTLDKLDGDLFTTAEEMEVIEKFISDMFAIVGGPSLGIGTGVGEVLVFNDIE